MIDFLIDLKNICDENDIRLRLLNDHGIKQYKCEKSAYCGYFDPHNRELGCATKRADWLGILVHESCHLDQFLEGAKAWTDAFPKGKEDYCTRLDNWLCNKPVKNINHVLDIVLNLELDCEKRTVKKIKEYKLDINVIDYIKRANAYIYFYEYMKKCRKWYSQAPYTNELIVKAMPPKFKKNYILTDKIQRAFEKNCGIHLEFTD